MISLRLGAVLLLPVLGFGCFLDEAPKRDGSSASSAMAAGTRASTAFMPREPTTSSTRTQSADAGPGTSQDAAAQDAGARASTGMNMDAAVQKPSQHPDSGTAVAKDAGTRPDAHVPQDAGASASPDAHVPQSTAGARPPTAADAGVSMPGQSTPAPIEPIHRYDFSGSGRTVVDLIAGKNASLQGDVFLDAHGAVELGQSQDDFVELPDRILAGLTGFTLLGWMELRTQDCFRRLFDFIYYREGQSAGGRGGRQGQSSTQGSALYLTPYACPDNFPRLGYVTEQSQVALDGEDELGDNRQVLLGAAYDSKTGVLQLIVDGVIVAHDDVPIALRELSAARGRLGSPTNSQDRQRYGSITEFRIYDRALDAATLAEIARRGSDTL